MSGGQHCLSAAELIAKLELCYGDKPVYMASDAGVADDCAVVDVEECADCVVLILEGDDGE